MLIKKIYCVLGYFFLYLDMISEQDKEEIRKYLLIFKSNDAKSLKKVAPYYSDIISQCIDIILNNDRYILREESYNNYIKNNSDKKLSEFTFHKVVCSNVFSKMINDIHYIITEGTHSAVSTIELTEDVEVYATIIQNAKRDFNLNKLV